MTKEPKEVIFAFREIQRRLQLEWPRTIRTDGGTEFAGEFNSALNEHVVKHEKGIAHRPNSDAIHERTHATLNPGVRSLLLHAGLDTRFSVYAAVAFCHAFNRLHANRRIGESPYERRHFRKPEFLHHVFGTGAVYLHDNASKHDPRGRVGILVGQEGDRLIICDYLSLKDNRPTIVTTKDAKVIENTYPARKLNLCKVELDVLFEDHSRNIEQICLTCGKQVGGVLTCPKCIGHKNTQHTRDNRCKTSICKCETSKPFGETRDVREANIIHNAPVTTPPIIEITKMDHSTPENLESRESLEETRMDSSEQMVLNEDSIEEWNDIIANDPIAQSTDQDVSFTEEIQDSIQEEAGIIASRAPARATEPIIDMVPDSTTYLTQRTKEKRTAENSPPTTPPRRSKRLREKLFMSKIITAHEARCCPEKWETAIKKELRAHLQAGTFDMDNILEKDEVPEDKTTRANTFVRGKFVYCIKNYELPSSEHTYKARLVAQGCNVRDQNGRKVLADPLELPYDVPGGIETLRIFLSMCNALGYEGLVSDIDYAYLHANLGGGPVYMYLPKELAPPGMRKPVARLKKALYGLQRSGGDFAHHARSILEKLGYKSCDIDRNLYIKKVKGEQIFIFLYVDDIFVGTHKNLCKIVELELKKAFTITKPFHVINENGVRFLGMNIRKDGNGGISLGLKEFTADLLSEYKELTKGNKQDNRPLKVSKVPYKLDFEDADLNGQGELEDIAAHFVGSLLWLARTTRPDIMTAVVILARHVHKWSLYADKCLMRIFQYLEGTLDKRLIINKVDPKTLRLVGYTDADLAGCVLSARSTTGYCIFGRDSQGNSTLLDWGSMRQGAVLDSTPASELYALTTALKTSFIPIVLILAEMGINPKTELLCDNTAVIRDAHHGYSKKLRYLRRIVKTSLGLVHDYISRDDVTLSHVKSEDNIADIFTKPLAWPSYSRHLRSLEGELGCQGNSDARKSDGKKIEHRIGDQGEL